MRPLPGRMKSQGRPPSLGRNSRQRAVRVSDFQPSPAPAATAIHPPLQALQDLLAVTPVGVGGDAGLTARGVAILHSPCMPPAPCLLPAGLPPKSRPHCSPVPPAWDLPQLCRRPSFSESLGYFVSCPPATHTQPVFSWAFSYLSPGLPACLVSL